MRIPETILVPTDLSPFSLSALQYAQAIADPFGARIAVLYVCEGGDPATVDYEQPDVSPGLEAQERHARQVLSQILINNKIVSQTIQIIVRHGSPVGEIVQTAKDIHADLIVMSTHGHTGLRHVLMGSVAEKVVRLATTPVLTVKPREFIELVAITEEDVAETLRDRQ